MWFQPAPGQPDWSPAERYLRAADPVLEKVIDRVGPCTLHPRRDYFVVLCKAIFTQQISTAVATVLFGRFRDRFPLRRPTPPLVLEFLNGCEPDAIKQCGLSRQKAAYLKDLAEHFASGAIPTRRLGRMGDEEVIDALVRVKGIGRWTAEMFLIFTLNRPDVLPVDDLGLQEGVRELYGLGTRPLAKELTGMTEAWRPWRTVATWYVWRRGGVRPDGSPPPTRRAAAAGSARPTKSRTRRLP